ncbi:hypothetical protein [Inediibacterium massiliense]|uniref:hypothetical protein n=1 Tax=Inediibacterium massiliense TaxID=1658111 RepID=UPI0006B47B6F|nr:hypothetical protein [Inediibacterium massiliense]
MYTSITRHDIQDMLKGDPYLVYEKIKRFMNFSTMKSTVSIKRLVEETGRSKNTVLKAIRYLVENEFLIKKKSFNKEKMEYNTNEYYFYKEAELIYKEKKSKSYEHVVHEGDEVVHKKEHNKNNTDKSVIVEKTIDVESIKKQLEKKYSIDIVKKAVQCLQRAVKHGTIVNNLKSYLNTLCVNIKAQLNLIASISDSNVHDVHKEPQKSKIPSATNTRYQGKNKFHNFFQRTSLYSKEELEKMLLK